MSRKAILIALVVVLAAVGVSRLFKSAGAPERTAAVARVGEVVITPARAHAQSELTARVGGARGRVQEVESCTWYKNGAPIDGVTSATLDPSYFGKGDEIVAVAVTVPGMPAQRSQPVVIQGARPQISSGLTLQREGTTEAYAQVTAMDADGEALTYRYAWYRNGEEIPGATGETLDVSGYRSGDRIHAQITAFDGEEASAPLACTPLVLGSDALAITSTPPQATVEGRYVYQVTTTRHATGRVEFILDEAPLGMRIDENGRIDWELPQDQIDVVVHTVAVRVSHSSGGEAVQRFSITTGPVTTAAQ